MYGPECNGGYQVGSVSTNKVVWSMTLSSPVDVNLKLEAKPFLDSASPQESEVGACWICETLFTCDEKSREFAVAPRIG